MHQLILTELDLTVVTDSVPHAANQNSQTVKQGQFAMQDKYFFDQALAIVEAGELRLALGMVVGHLYRAHNDQTVWPQTKETLNAHPLLALLRQDPFSALSVAKPRGYAGDAGLIDMIYDKVFPTDTPQLAADIFECTIRFQAPEGVRQRRQHAEQVIAQAVTADQSVCVLACGHFREADPLIGQDLSNVTVVDQDPISLTRVREKHGTTINIHEANVFRYLRQAAARGDKFDLIYTLGLTDYLDVRAMSLMHRLIKNCLAPGGSILLANFVPDHLATGWMDAIMDWQLIYRDEDELVGYAREIGLAPKTWRDETGSIVWCKMEDDR